MIRICKGCDKTFEQPKRFTTYCPDCLKKKRQTNVIRQSICKQCKAVFEGGPRAWYCPKCRKERRNEADKKYKHEGAKRQIGSVDQCQVCNQDYIVNAARQKYCKKCAQEAVREKDRQSAIEYYKNNPDPNRKERRRAKRICVICGADITNSGSKKITCTNVQCRIELKKRYKK